MIVKIPEKVWIYEKSEIWFFFQISKSSLFDLCGIVEIDAMFEISEISIYIN